MSVRTLIHYNAQTSHSLQPRSQPGLARAISPMPLLPPSPRASTTTTAPSAPPAISPALEKQFAQWCQTKQGMDAAFATAVAQHVHWILRRLRAALIVPQAEGAPVCEGSPTGKAGGGGGALAPLLSPILITCMIPHILTARPNCTRPRFPPCLLPHAPPLPRPARRRLLPLGGGRCGQGRRGPGGVHSHRRGGCGLDAAAAVRCDNDYV